MDNVSPRIEGNGRGSAVGRGPRRACAKVGFAITAGTGVVIGVYETVCVKSGTVLLPDVAITTGMAGGARSACQSNMTRAKSIQSEEVQQEVALTKPIDSQAIDSCDELKASGLLLADV